MNIINNIIFLVEKKLKLKLVYLFFLTLIGAFLETLGVGIILPLLMLITQGKLALQEILNKAPDFINNNINLTKFTDNDLIIYFIAFTIIIFFLKTLFFIFLIWRQNQFAHQVDSSISKRMFNFYLNKSYLFHTQKNSSKLFRNIIEEVKGFRHYIISSSLTLSIEILVLMSISSLIIYLQPVPAISAACLIFICIIILSKIIKRRLIKISKERQYHDALKIQHLNQGLNGIKEIKISRKEKEFLSIFDKHNLMSVKMHAENQFWNLIPKYILEFAAVFTFMAIAIFVAKKGYDLKFFIPTIGMIGVATFRLLPSANKIVQSINNIRFGIPSADILVSELKEDKEENIYTKPLKILPNNYNKIIFNKVSFCYPNSEKKIIKDATFEISKGDKIGILGPSGSGKSTLVDLITGLIKPTTGIIKLDNLEVTLMQKNWYERLGYVSQFIFLTDDTIKKNIAFGIEEKKINENSINIAINTAQLKEFITSCPKGIDTSIGEFGARISGGQRQRIGIARAVYAQPRILVLDEATSAIDSKTEDRIINNINTLTNKTIIIISHRLSTIKDCNKIFEFKDGILNQKK